MESVPNQKIFLSIIINFLALCPEVEAGPSPTSNNLYQQSMDYLGSLPSPASSQQNHQLSPSDLPKTPREFSLYDQQLLLTGGKTSELDRDPFGYGFTQQPISNQFFGNSNQRSNLFGTSSNGKEQFHNGRRLGSGSERVNTNGGLNQAQVASQPQYWCYHCASPLDHAKPPHKHALQQLLDLRFADYPKRAVNQECHLLGNISAIQRQSCKTNYCYSITVGNDFTGNLPLTIRGCAENFVATNVDKFQTGLCRAIPSNDRLPIRECVCHNRHVCNEHVVNDRGYARTTIPSLALLIVGMVIHTMTGAH